MLCKKCIMPLSYPNVSFNEKGICNFCLDFKSQKPLGETELIKLIKSLKTESKYNCVVPISGGKDSIFILYYVKKILNLNPVAVNYNSGMQSELAINNQINACKVLNVPLIIKRADHRIQYKRLNALMKFSERLGKFGFGCGDCVPIMQNLTIGYAESHNIPIVFDGGSFKEHYKKSVSNINYILSQNIIGRFIKSILKWKLYIIDIIKYVYLLKYFYYNYILNKQMKLGYYKVPPFGYYKSYNNGKVTIIRFSNFIEWPEEKIVKLIKKELNWENPLGQDKRFDCLLHCLADHLSLQEFGISSNGIVYSNMIREGLITRRDAIYKELKSIKELNANIMKLIKKLKIRKYKIPKL